MNDELELDPDQHKRTSSKPQKKNIAIRLQNEIQPTHNNSNIEQASVNKSQNAKPVVQIQFLQVCSYKLLRTFRIRQF